MDSSFNHLLSSFFFLLLFFFSNHTLNGMARSDDINLINTLCSKTEEPVICRECLQADPNSKSANGQGLALIAIACAERDTSLLHEDTLKLLQSATGKLRGILEDCTQHSLSAQNEFPPVARHVQEGRYQSAVGIIAEEIIPSVMYCLNLFDQTPELPVPQQVLAGTVASNQTCRNAVEILNSI